MIPSPYEVIFMLFQSAFIQRKAPCRNHEIKQQRLLEKPDLHKIYIAASAICDKVGNLTPIAIHWGGIRYDIELVKDIRKINEQKTGEKGLRYTCSINGKDRHVFLDMERYDRYRWYVESTEPEPEDFAE